MVDFRSALAQQLLSRGAMGGNTIGSGLNALGSSIGGALLARGAQQAADERMAATNAAFDPIIAALTGTGGTVAGGPGAPMSLAGPRQAFPGAEPGPVQVASTGGAGFSTGGGMDRKAILGMMLSNPDLLRDPRAAAILPMLAPAESDVVSPEREAQLIRLADARRPQTTVTVDARGNKLPPPPAGFMYVTVGDQTQLEPIPGGPAAIAAEERAGEAETEAARAASAEEGRQTQAGMMAEEIGRARDLVINQGLLPNTGAIGSMLSNVGGTDAGDLKQLLTTISANISFDRLSRMRQESKTGGALGQVTPRELELLAATQGALAQSQSEEQLLFNLDRMARTFNEIVHGNPEGPEAAVEASGEAPQGPLQEGATATNPETGERLIFRNGEWVPFNG